jgi:hypothetical protein
MLPSCQRSRAEPAPGRVASTQGLWPSIFPNGRFRMCGGKRLEYLDGSSPEHAVDKSSRMVGISDV